MKNKITYTSLREPTMLLALFSLSLVSASVHAGITQDCGGSSYCTNKTIDANAAGYIDKTPVYFAGDSRLTVSASDAFNNASGIYEFRENTQVDVNAEKGLNGGTYTLRGNSGQTQVKLNITAKDGLTNAKLTALANSQAEINVNQTHGISHSALTLNAGTTLNINASNGLHNNSALTVTDAEVNLNAKDAYTADSLQTGKAASIKGASTVNINKKDAMSGGQLNIQDSSSVNINAGGSVNGGILLISGKSQMNINSQNGVTGPTDGSNKQIFQSGTQLNINASSGLAGGNQTFNSAILNVNAEQGIAGGYQIMAGSSQLNTHADNAISGGLIKLQDNATLNTTNNNVITGGTQNFTGASILNASGTDTLVSGTQNFSQNSVFNTNGSGGITGNSRQTFSNQSVMNANSQYAINGGASTTFKDDATLNVNAEQGISGGTLLFDGHSVLNINTHNGINNDNSSLRFKGDATINLNHQDALADTTLKLEGNAGILINHDNALNHTTNIEFAKTYDTSTGSYLDLNGHSTTVGTISGNDDQAVIKNSADNNADLTSGLYDYRVYAGQSYQFEQLLQSGAMRSDAVVSTAVADILRQSSLAMLPQYSDRLITAPNGMAQTGQGIWVRTLYAKQQNSGDGAANPEWKGHVSGIQIGSDLWPSSDNSPSKIGVYLGYVKGDANVYGKTLDAENTQLGKVELDTLSPGIYWRYVANQGWYTQTTFQYNHYRGKVNAHRSQKHADLTANGYLVALETGYPMAINEYFSLAPRLQVTYQSLNLDDYQFSDLAVNNHSDEQISVQAGARMYWRTMSISGTQYAPFIDIELNNQLSSRDRNQVRINSSNHTESLLTTYQQTSGVLGAGVNVKLNDSWNYYVKAGYQHAFNDHQENVWHSSAGLNFNW